MSVSPDVLVWKLTPYCIGSLLRLRSQKTLPPLRMSRTSWCLAQNKIQDTLSGVLSTALSLSKGEPASWASRRAKSKGVQCMFILRVRAGAQNVRAPDEHGALSSFVFVSHSYYYFSPSVPFLQIPDSRRDFTQCVTPVDDWRYFSCFHQLFQDDQVLFVY